MGVSGSAAILLPDTPVCEGIVQVRAVRSVGYAGLWWTRAAGLCACGALGGIMAFSVPLMRCTGSGGSHDSRGDQCFGVAGSGLTPREGDACLNCVCVHACAAHGCCCCQLPQPSCRDVDLCVMTLCKLHNQSMGGRLWQGRDWLAGRDAECAALRRRLLWPAARHASRTRWRRRVHACACMQMACGPMYL